VAKSLSCREVGMDCDTVIRGETVDDVLMKGAEHARRDHGMTDDQLKDPQLEQRLRSLIHDA
jgi:predicted small metal-binding protein